MTVQEFLNKQGINFTIVSRPKGKQAMFPCPQCGDKNFSMSIDDGAFSCLRKNNCGISGAWADYLKMIGKDFIPLNMEGYIIKKPKIYDKPKVKSDPLTKELDDFFRLRKISTDTAKYFKIGLKNDYILFPYYKNKELVNVKHRNLKEKKFLREKGCMSTLFNQDNIDTNYLIITEGEIDAMSLLEYGLNGVSIPSGVNDLGWIENDYEFLEKFETIYIIMDSDLAGQTSVETLVNRLGKWRCKNVLLPFKDLNECLVRGTTKETIYETIFDKSQDYGLNELRSISSYTDAMLKRNSNPDLMNGKETSFSKLNKILKGWRKKEVTLWTGQNGSGKTTMLTQELLHCATKNNELVCIGSFEMPPELFLLWMTKQYLEKEVLTDEEIIGTTRFLNDKIFIIDIEDTIEKDRLFQIMEFASMKYGINHYCIDSLMKVNLSVNESKIYGEQKNFLSDLKNFAKNFDTHIHLVAHPRKSSHDSDIPGKVDVSGSSDITNLADNLIVMHRLTSEQKDEIMKEGKEAFDTYLMVKKHRAHGELGTVGLYFDNRIKKFETRDYNDKPKNWNEIEDKSNKWHGGN